MAKSRGRAVALAAASIVTNFRPIATEWSRSKNDADQTMLRTAFN